MRIPRDLTGSELIKKLKKMGYTTTRQSGSHIRITTTQQGEHHITIPNHDPIKIGTLSSILTDIAQHFNISKEEFLKLIL